MRHVARFSPRLPRMRGSPGAPFPGAEPPVRLSFAVWVRLALAALIVGAALVSWAGWGRP